MNYMINISEFDIQALALIRKNIKNLYRVNNSLICGTIADPVTNKLIKDPTYEQRIRLPLGTIFPRQELNPSQVGVL